MSTVTRPQAIVTGLATIAAAWRERFGEDPDPVTLETLACQVMHESFFGRNVEGYSKLEAGTNNYGSYQATPDFRAQHAHDKGYGEIGYVDAHFDGSHYSAALRVYPTQLAAAKDWLALVLYYAKRWGGWAPGKVLTAEMLGEALGFHGPGKSYSETAASSYTWLIKKWQPAVRDAQAKGLAPEPVDQVLPDDFPPDAAKRIVLYVGLLPGQGGIGAEFTTCIADTTDLEAEELTT